MLVRPASRWSGGRAATIGSSMRAWRRGPGGSPRPIAAAWKQTARGRSPPPPRPATAGVLAALDRGVLEADGQVQLALADPLGQRGRAVVDHADLELGLGLAQARDRRRDDRRERARERAEAQPARLGADQLAELRACE